MKRNVMTALAPRPGAISGVTIWTSVLSVPAPSIAADSSISFGTSWTKPMRSQMATGSFAAVCARISDVRVSRSPRLAKTAKSGIASATTGIMRMMSNSVTMTRWPGRRNRAIA